ncbi:tetratricopeptide repeat protein, partial [Ectothiorhodospira lacustris]|uniref:tetratricopeptide repeat protein n=1 Tax=Ectothiorhodospira lacustris TaxID=2899127 RepID=UPI001EE9546F
VLLHLAGAYLALNDENEALLAYRQVIKIQPNHVPALNNVAWLSRDHNIGDAITYAERAFALSPNDPYVLDTLGMLKLKQGNIDEAYQLIRNAADMSNDARIHLHLADILYRQGNQPEALQLVKDLAESLPGTEEGDQAKSMFEQWSLN